MRVLMEFLRIIFLLFIFGMIGGVITKKIYSPSPAVESYAWLGGLALFILFFVLYRNKLQFTGWYKSERKKKLPKSVSSLLIVLASILLISPYVLSYFLS